MRTPLWLIPSLLLTACGTPPPPPAPEPRPEVKAEQPAGPQPFENEVISVPVSPLQELPQEW
ncbi:hypothetical protein GU3_03060 [Oceanimonas sp. GK1]|uniref:hypothetical protein n=1 Tax=Oceanimonas sp. (strain GK1 / IBRC-M 10197) TaxID=511062 RepID=UPI0002494C19|nr:hypothetical protein [Oceanimonas sp. GK1]AEY00369.1 hypothetical protein GU3_03060 [Oceanimonas sp. GK1]